MTEIFAALNKLNRVLVKYKMNTVSGLAFSPKNLNKLKSLPDQFGALYFDAIYEKHKLCGAELIDYDEWIKYKDEE